MRREQVHSQFTLLYNAAKNYEPSERGWQLAKEIVEQCVDDPDRYRITMMISLMVDELQTRDRLLNDMLCPEMYGHAVTAEIRDRCRTVLGMQPVETVRRK